VPKTRIVDLLGETALALPGLIDAALVANEQAKFVLALIQMAMGHADNPSPGALPNLRAEREACGIAEPRLDRVIPRSEALGPSTYYIPEAAHLVALLSTALDAMLAPLVGAQIDSAAALGERKSRLIAAIPPIEGDVITGETIAELTSGRPAAGDGVHVLILDLHRELNKLQAAIAEETVAGAAAYRISAVDRPLIEAFMAGVARTAALKFDHPGLGTTATRSGDTLLIQNDIGATAAHVLMLRIAGAEARVTYSDVHPQRLRFFQNMLNASSVVWEDLHSQQARGLADADLFYVTVGRFTAADDAAMRAFLDRLGSRIVFLIDWNKARKRLGLMVPNSLAVELLTWAAEEDFGHRAFLQLGGERLVFDALEQAVRTPLRYGEPLHEMLGAEAAADYLRFVLQTAASGLRSGHSETLIRDWVRAELFNHFRSAEQRLLMEQARHAAIIGKLADRLFASLRHATSPQAKAETVEAAKRLESEADDIVRHVRSTVQRIGSGDILRRIIEIADDAADELEDAAFLAGIDIAGGDDAIPAALVELAEMVVDGARAFERAIETAPWVRRGADREPVQDFLQAVDRLVIVEHETDAKERDVTTALLGAPADARQLYRLGTIAHHLETAADSLLEAGLTLRDHMLGEVMFD